MRVVELVVWSCSRRYLLRKINLVGRRFPIAAKGFRASSLVSNGVSGGSQTASSGRAAAAA